MLSPRALQKYNNSRGLKDTSVVCHAPFNSMYFMPEGQMVPCCYNRSHLYGRYPEVTVEQAWFGAEAVAFREMILKRRFDVGCSRCLDQITVGNHSGVHARIYDRPLTYSIRESENGVTLARAYPEILEFELHNLCNLECVMCGGMHSHLIRQNREGLPPLQSPYDKAFVAQLLPFVKSASTARFLGGEPFLIPVYFEIWESFMEHNPDAEIHITTNATVLNNRVWRVLERCNVHPVISVDSLDQANYESIRINASFQKFWDNLREFKNYCELEGKQLTFTCCPIQQNWKHLPEVLEYCCTNRVQLYFNTVVMPETASLRFLEADQLLEVIQFLESELQRITEKSAGNEHGWRGFLPWVKREAGSLTEVVQLNISSFQDLIRQLRSWHEERRAEASRKTPSEADPWVTHLLNIQGISIEKQSLEHRLSLFNRLKVNLNRKQLIALCRSLFAEENPVASEHDLYEWLRWICLQDWTMRGLDLAEQNRLTATLNDQIHGGKDEASIFELLRRPMNSVISELSHYETK